MADAKVEGTLQERSMKAYFTDTERVYMVGACQMAIKSVERLARSKEAEGKMNTAKGIRDDLAVYESIIAKVRTLA